MPKLAVLKLQNYCGERYSNLTKALQEMLITKLGSYEKWILVERTQIKEALMNLKFEETTLDENKSIEIGKWLKADLILLGSITKFEDIFRLDARIIDVSTGKFLTGAYVKGKNPLDMIDSLGTILILNYENLLKEKCEIVIKFKIEYKSIIAREVYKQICKIYVDGKFAGLSPVIDDINKWYTIYKGEVKKGFHEIKVIHYYVDEKNSPSKELKTQPKIFRIKAIPNRINEIKYCYRIGTISEKFVYFKQEGR